MDIETIKVGFWVLVALAVIVIILWMQNKGWIKSEPPKQIPPKAG